MTPLRSATLFTLAAVASVCLVAGCSEKKAGQPTSAPATGGTTSETAASSSSAAPGLSFAKFVDKPCTVLTSTQLTSLGTFKEPKPSTDSTGAACRWAATDPTTGISYTVSLLTDGSTIDEITENVKTSPVYRKAEVSGLPAVSSDSTDAKGTCTTAVGASSKDAFLVQISTLNESTPEYKDSCGATEKVAALVIQNLKG